MENNGGHSRFGHQPGEPFDSGEQSQNNGQPHHSDPWGQQSTEGFQRPTDLHWAEDFGPFGARNATGYVTPHDQFQHNAPQGQQAPGYASPEAVGGAEGQPHIFPAPPAQRPKKNWSTGAVVAMVIGAAVVASATTFALGGLQESQTITNTLTEGQPSSGTSRLPEPGTTAEVAQKVTPSVVQIQVQTARGGEEGSGSIFTNDGMILTNNHVVGAAAQNGRIQVVLHDGRILPAEFVAADPQTDIAVIKAKGAKNLQSMSMGDSDAINVGEPIAAIGSPLGLNSTVTSGIVSAKNRPVQAAGEGGGESSLIDAIQTDAAINPGNSGGALVNMNGELVGIPTVIATLGGQGTSGSIGLGFAIPSNQAVRIAKQLIDKGEATHPVIGAQINTAARVIGAEVVEVTRGGPAEKAGLKKGDVVLKVDDRPIDSGVGLIAAIRSHEVGDTVRLTVREGNDGPERELNVTLSDAQ